MDHTTNHNTRNTNGRLPVALDWPVYVLLTQRDVVQAPAEHVATGSKMKETDMKVDLERFEVQK